MLDQEFLKNKAAKQKNLFGKQDEIDSKLQELTKDATDVRSLKNWW